LVRPRPPHPGTSLIVRCNPLILRLAVVMIAAWKPKERQAFILA